MVEESEQGPQRLAQVGSVDHAIEKAACQRVLRGLAGGAGRGHSAELRGSLSTDVSAALGQDDVGMVGKTGKDAADGRIGQDRDQRNPNPL